MSKKILIGDFGGTNINIAIVNVKKNSFDFLYHEKFKTKEADNLENFINNITKKIDTAVFSLAGEIINNKAKLTNANLEIDKLKLSKNTSLSNIYLLNDFEALAYSINLIEKKNIKTIQKNNNNKNNKSLIIGAGTGLGTSFKINNEVITSEAGHTQILYKPQDMPLINFFKEIKNKEIISWEDVLSGRGLEIINEFFNGDFKSAEYINCQITFNTFFYFYAQYIKQMCLIFQPSNIYLYGGIIQKNIEKLNKLEFKRQIDNNQISISIIKNYDAPLYGLINSYKIKH